MNLRPLSVLFGIALFAIPAFASAQVVTLPSVPQASASGQVVGANFQNPTSAALPAHAVELGQAFVDGAVPGTSGLSASINGVAAATQLDVKTSYADGSVKYGVITVMAPQLTANSTNPTMFSLSTKPTTALSLATMPGYSFTVAVDVSGGSTYTLNAATLLAQALSADTVSYWRQGPVVTEGRVTTDVTGALRVIFDIAKYSDGSYSTDVQFANDIGQLCPTATATDVYCTAAEGTLTYTTTITQDGTVVYQSPSLTNYQYEGWNMEFYTNSTPGVNVQHDIPYLEKVGVIQNYDLTNGVDESTIASYASTIASDADWMGPFDIAGITQYMPTTGGRGDIGPTTQYNTVWLVTQDPTAAEFALGQANAAAGIPWHFWNATAADWYNTAQVPTIWTAPGAHPEGTIPLLQGVDPTNNGWATDGAHQPDLSYIPYLLTGNRFYLDQLNAQAAWSETGYWPSEGSRIDGSYNDIVLSTGNQVRGAAWDFREIDEAAWANPDGSTDKAYFTQAVSDNFAYLASQESTWQADAGSIYGFLPGVYGTVSSIAPWQQDYLMAAISQAAELGVSAAKSYLGWAANFMVGRFLNQANGFNPRDGVSYNLQISDASGNPYTTWAELQAGAVAIGEDNGTGWAASGGDYGPLGIETLAEYVNLFGSSSTVGSQAATAYNWLTSAAPPESDVASYQSDPTFDVVPSNFTPSSATLTASPSAIITGKSTTLTWTSTNATTCSGTGFSASGASGSVSVSPAQTTAYTITCTSASGTSVTANTTVIVGSATVSPDGSTLAVGATGSLTTSAGVWTFDGSQGVGSGGASNYVLLNGQQAAGAWAGELEVADGGNIFAGAYTSVGALSGSWSEWNGSAWVSASAPTAVATPAPAVSLTASPASIASGQSSTLTWSSTNATTCTSTGFTASGVSGSTTVSPTADATYSITCTGAGGSASASAALTITAASTPPPTTTTGVFSAGERVVTTSALNVRASAGTGGALVGTEPKGSLGTIVSGPTTTNGYIWWNVDYDDGTAGWSVQKYLAASSAASAPTSTASFTAGEAIMTTSNLNVRANPSTSATLVGVEFTGSTGTIVSGPSTANGYTWWDINYDDGTAGWSIQNYLAAQSTIPAPTPTPTPVASTVLKVGPTEEYQLPSEAEAAAVDGDTIEIDAGTYTDDFTEWSQNDLTIEGIGGMVHLVQDANGTIPNGKAIWTIDGNNVSISNIAFSGATVPDGNGAGIRAEGGNLTITNSDFDNNQDGILSSANPAASIVISNSEFGDNGTSAGNAHNIYIGNVGSFTLEYSYSHSAIVGHLVKSRANVNYILYNRLTGEQGSDSYELDLPNGGTSYVIGNLIEKGPNSDNDGTLLAYAEEGATNPSQQLYVINNTFVNDDSSSPTFVNDAGTPSGEVMNNLFVGSGTAVAGTSLSASDNVTTTTPGFVDQATYNYQLTASSPAIGAGANAGSANGVSLDPTMEYVQPTSSEPRPVGSRIDAGAYQYAGTVTTTPTTTPAVATATLSAAAASLTAGQSTSLTWSSANTTSCSGTGFSAAATAGSVTVTPSTTTTYSITCGTASASATVSVAAAPVGNTLSPNGSTLSAGASGSLTTAAGTWTFSTQTAGGGNEILLNGQWVGSGSAVELAVANGGTLYALNTAGAWFQWNGSGWTGLSTSPLASTTPAPTTTTTTSSTLGNGLIAEWALNGSFNDSSGNNLNGTGVGSPTFAAGNLGGQAVELNGSNYVSIPANPLLNLASSGGSVSGWFDVSTPATAQDTVWPIFVKLDSGNGADNGGVRLTLYEGSPNSPMYLTGELSNQNGESASGQPSEYITGTTPITVGVWHHAVLTWNGSTVSLYLDGQLQTQQTQTTSIAYYEQAGALVGDAPGTVTNGDANGLIEDVRLYNRALLPSEVASLYQEGSGTVAVAHVTQTLALGSEGAQVEVIQSILSALGLLNSQVTGYFGSLTEQGVATLQKESGLAAVGVVGPLTRDLINSIHW